MNTALSIEVGSNLPLIVPIRDVLEMIARLRGEGPLTRSDTPRAFDRERFVNRISSRHLLETINQLNIPQLLAESKLGSEFYGRAGASQVLRSNRIHPEQRHPDQDAMVIIAYARNTDGCPPIETGHLFMIGDLRLEAAIERYRSEGLAVDYDIIKMLRRDLETCPRICVVSSWLEFAPTESSEIREMVAASRS